MSFPYTVDDSPRLRDAVQADLDRLVGALGAWEPGAGLALAGSFARGEAVAWVRDDRLCSRSDYDLLVALPGPGPLARLGALRTALQELAPQLNNPRVDCNLLLPGAAAWQAQGTLPVLAGSVPSVAGTAPGAALAFALHSLHEAQRGLLAMAPCLGGDPAVRRAQLNRCGLTVLRAAWNLEAPQPVHSLRACREPLDSAWGQTHEDHLRSFFADALRENPGLGLAAASPLEPAALAARWIAARRAVETLYERWHWQLYRADSGAARAVRRERLKGRARLAWSRLRSARLPRPDQDAHLGVFAARRDLLEAALPDGSLDPSWLERGLHRARQLGLGPRRWPDDPVEAFALAGRIALPNPLRIVVG